MSDATSVNRRRGVRVLGLGFALLFALLVLAGLVAHFGFQAAPSHWVEEQARLSKLTHQQRKAASESLLGQLLNDWSAAPQNPTSIDDLFGQRSTLVIPYPALNVWLAEAGPAQLREVGIKLPNAISAAMVDCPRPGELRISCAIDTARGQQIVSLTCAIAMDNDGSVIGRLRDARAGRVSLPTQTLIALLDDRAGEDGRLIQIVRGTPFGPIILPIDAGKDGLRDGRLVDLEVREDALVIVRESVRRNSAKN